MMMKLITATTLASTMLSGSISTPKPTRMGWSSHVRVCSTGSRSGCHSSGRRLAAAAAATNENDTAPRSRALGCTRASSGVNAAPASGAPILSHAANTVTPSPLQTYRHAGLDESTHDLAVEEPE